MMSTRKNEDAVSPVIGVILMVAITVILAAVIAAFVFGMAGGLQKTHIVMVTGSRYSTTQINVVDQGGQDQSALTSLTATTATNITGCTASGSGTITPASDFASGLFASCTLVGPQVGATMILKNETAGAVGFPTPTHLIVTGMFADGTTQVLVEQNV